MPAFGVPGYGLESGLTADLDGLLAAFRAVTRASTLAANARSGKARLHFPDSRARAETSR